MDIEKKIETKQQTEEAIGTSADPSQKKVIDQLRDVLEAQPTKLDVKFSTANINTKMESSIIINHDGPSYPRFREEKTYAIFATIKNTNTLCFVFHKIIFEHTDYRNEGNYTTAYRNAYLDYRAFDCLEKNHSEVVYNNETLCEEIRNLRNMKFTNINDNLVEAIFEILIVKDKEIQKSELLETERLEQIEKSKKAALVKVEQEEKNRLAAEAQKNLRKAKDAKLVRIFIIGATIFAIVMYWLRNNL